MSTSSTYDSSPLQARHTPPKDRRRPPATLRTKSGCLTCRQRRKKCDEMKPTCISCTRNALSCTWHLVASSSTVSRSTLVSSDVSTLHISSGVPNPSASSKPYLVNDTYLLKNPNFEYLGISDHLDMYLFQNFRDQFLPSLIRPDAHMRFCHSQHLLSIVVNNPILSKAVLACSALQLAGTMPEFEDISTRYYSAAITATRSEMANMKNITKNDAIILPVIFFNIYEIWAATSWANASVHIKGANQFLALRYKHTLTNPGLASHEESDIEILNTESVIFHLSTMALLCPELVNLPVDHLWKTTPATVRESLHISEIYPTKPAESPVLGGSHGLFRIIFDSSRLSYHMPLSSSNLEYAKSLLEKLSEWDQFDKPQITLEQIITPENPTGSIQLHYIERLYTICGRILLLNVMAFGSEESVSGENSVTTKTADILAQGLTLVNEDVINQKCSTFYSWPLLILGSVSRSLIDQQKIRWALDEIWKVSWCKDVLMIKKLLEGIWKTEYIHVERTRKVVDSEDDIRKGVHKIASAIRSDGTETHFSKIFGVRR